MKFLLLMSLYLLGSARSESSTLALGASGLPVEPLAFMDHMTSAQRLSSQYFSPASPSGSRTSYATSPGKTTSGDEHALVGRALGEHSTGERASGRPAAVSEHAVVEHTSGEQPAVEHTSGEQSSGEQPLGEQASGEQVSDEQPSGEQVSGEKQLDEQPPAMLSTTVSGSVLNCYTCSYMNDQGQCLHGEGVCSTQSSQQCMLKKIFEGGKLQFMVQGCENKCPSMSLFSHGTRMHIICCQNESFCNKV